MQRTAIHAITFVARCESGLHIGGSQDELVIGGADSPVIKNPDTRKPYVPGSSLKGKMRAELEKHLGRFGRDGRKDGDKPLACSWARANGPGALRRDFLEPWLAGEPPFVVSDAFPGDSLPAPAGVSLWWDWPADRRKDIKKRRWFTTADFRRVQQGEPPRLESTSVAVREHVRLRNSVSRVTDAAGSGGQLFEVPYSDLSVPDRGLSLYVRASRCGMDTLLQALEALGRTGYGADASIGHGGFEVVAEPRACPELTDVPDADAFISLSTYQPARTDPVDGFWRVFVKYGKLAPEFHDTAVFKRPQAMLEAGACFRTGGRPRRWYGGPIGPDRLLAPADREALSARDVRPVQAAFCLAVPARWISTVSTKGRRLGSTACRNSAPE